MQTIFKNEIKLFNIKYTLLPGGRGSSSVCTFQSRRRRSEVRLMNLLIYGNRTLKCRKMSKKNKEQEPNEITEMWREHRKHVQATKAKIRTERTNTVFGQIFELKEAGIEVFELTPYQYRLVQGNRRIDYYPTSGKYFDLNTKEWRFIPAHKILTLFDL